MSPPDLAALWPALCRQRPQAGALARLVCLPVRVTPAFLRRVRLHLLPHSGTGDEADLWLSDLVETRTTAGFSLRRAVRAQLREALADDPTTLDAVWQGAHRPHATWLAPRARLEEELTWRLLRDRTDPAIVAAWATVLQQLDAAPDAEAWARWVVRAVPDLPAGALHTLPAQRAWNGAHLLLGDASVLGDQAQSFLASTDFGFATRRLPRRTVFVGRLADGLVVSPLLAIENGFALSIPATRPLWLQVERVPDDGPAAGDGAAAKWAASATPASSAAEAAPATAPQVQVQVLVLVLDGDARMQVAIDGGPLLLRAIDGAAWRLSPPPAVVHEAPAAPPPDEAPRVRLTYEVEINRAIKPVELPFVVGVLADLSGQPAEPLPPLADRRFLEIDRENFDARLRAIRPRLALRVHNLLQGQGELLIDHHFECLADFSPDALVKQVAPLQVALAGRQALGLLRADLATRPEAQVLVGELLDNRRMLAELAGVPSATGGPGTGLWLKRLQAALGDHSATAAQAQALAAATLALESNGQALVTKRLLGRPPTAPAGSALSAIDAALLSRDRRICAQISALLHHEAFKRLEGAWRGLHHLVDHAKTDERLKIRVLNVGKPELLAAMLPDLGLGDGGLGDADPAALAARLQRIGRAAAAEPGTAADITQTVVFKKVHEETFGQFGGEPYGLLVGDFHFDHRAPDLLLLDALGQVAAAAFAPLITGASPGVLQMESWRELAHPRDLSSIGSPADYAGWRALRGSAHARYIGLAMPRMLARAPYRPPADEAPGVGFQFTEHVDSVGTDPYTWANAAYAMAANIARAHSLHGWCARIRGVEGGGLVAGLPTATMPVDDGASARICSTEIALSDRREAELAKFGLMPLVNLKNRDQAAFFSAKPLHQPGDDGDGSVDSFQHALAASWPCLLPACGVMRVLKCMVRDKIGSFRDDDSLRQFLEAWLAGQVLGDAQTASQRQQARQPLAAGGVYFSSVAPVPGTVEAQVSLLPHYQLDGLGTPMRLTTTLPSMRAPA